MSEFRKIKSLPYEVSSRGDVRNILTGRTLKSSTNYRTGYAQICLSTDGRKIYKLIHRLVAEAFLGYSSLTVNHKDGNKINNELSNLEYMSRSDNQKHAYTIGLQKPNKGAAKLSEADVIVLKGLYLSGDFKQKDLAVLFSVSRPTVSMILSGARWKQ